MSKTRDYTLRWQPKVLQACFNILRELFPSRHMMPINLNLKLYETLILFKLAYCDSVYCLVLLKTDQSRHPRIQNSCIGFVYDIRKFDHISK